MANIPSTSNQETAKSPPHRSHFGHPLPSVPVPDEVADYPTGDGKPIGESPTHRDNLVFTVWAIRRHFADDPQTYVSGNMFLYYVRGDRRRHVSPDVFVARGVPNRYRDAYFTWLEGDKGPDVVIELTSPSTRDEDLDEKYTLYRDILRVREYYLFDPKEEYLDPPLQGFRLVEGEYVPIEPVAGRLPSEVIGLHLDPQDHDEEGYLRLRVYDPASGQWLPHPDVSEDERNRERAERQRLEAERDRERAERQRAEAERQRAEALRQHTETERDRERAERQRAEAEQSKLALALEHAEAERQRLLAELEAFRHRPPESGA